MLEKKLTRSSKNPSRNASQWWWCHLWTSVTSSSITVHVQEAKLWDLLTINETKLECWATLTNLNLFIHRITVDLIHYIEH